MRKWWTLLRVPRQVPLVLAAHIIHPLRAFYEGQNPPYPRRVWGITYKWLRVQPSLGGKWPLGWCYSPVTNHDSLLEENSPSTGLFLFSLNYSLLIFFERYYLINHLHCLEFLSKRWFWWNQTKVELYFILQRWNSVGFIPKYQN